MKQISTRLGFGIVMTLAMAVSACTVNAATLRYAAVVQGDVTVAGNALGLAKQTNANGPGTRDSIGTFITTDGGSVDNVPANPGNPWPAGTTSQWQQNGSTGALMLPLGSTVLYTELIWGGSYAYGAENVSAFLDSAIHIEGPQGGTLLVAPDPVSASTLAYNSSGGFAVNFYQRSADVTSFVAQQGAGGYTVRGVPATQSDTVNTLNAAGWSLIVAFADPNAPLRHLSVVTDGSFVEDGTFSDIAITGFMTPGTGTVTGHVVVAALEGDANVQGDQLLIGPHAAGLVALATAGNPVDNFFASQINDATGVTDATGSFGAANHDAAGGFSVSGARQGWDITGVVLSSVEGTLGNAQDEVLIRAFSNGDGFVLGAVGFAVDQVAAPVPLPGMAWPATALALVLLRRFRTTRGDHR
ncbi:MAG: hypothetical protein AB7Q81_10455 [Gammaproteobacteria bacterium]